MSTDDPDRDGSGQAAPAIPSFASLRGPRRRSPLDLLVPGEPPVAPVPHPRPPRPPEWADLLVLAARGAGVVVSGSTRLVRRLLSAPVRGIERVLGG